MSDSTELYYAELEKALLWDPFGNDGMRYMESADVTGGATDMVSLRDLGKI